ncbi:MAG: metallophosphatase [Paludibacter sp.]|nr:metallophosphatase [Paludibacter sp.]
MNSTKKLLISLSILCISFQVWGKSPRELFTFVQLTDIQMGMFSKNINNDEEIRLYSSAINYVNNIKPKFVIITGDFVNNRTDTNQIKAFKQLTLLISKNIPVYLIPGNHDVGQIPDKEKMDFYFKYYPTDKFDFRCKGVQFIGINSCLINSGTDLEVKQLNWLKESLMKKPASARKIVFTHHPFFTADINEKDSYSNIPQKKRLEYMQLFKTNGVKLIFAGHYHNNAQAQYDGIEMITTSAVGKQLGKAKSGFRVVTVFKDSISHKYIELPTD